QGKNSVEEYNIKFNLLKYQSGINNNLSLTEWYLQGLDNKILEQLFNNSVTPTTLHRWQNTA
ncbi:hypothetical protein BC835DRAFT_1233170, partial [Cytidiella melzeri]